MENKKKIINYPKIKRYEGLKNAIFEEKIDGSNFTFIRKEDGLHFYSRTQEVFEDQGDKFYVKFILFVKEIDKKEQLPLNIMFCGEALGQTKAKYWKNNVETKEKLWIFDIFDFNKPTEMENFYVLPREAVENYCKNKFNVVPLLPSSIVHPVIKGQTKYVPFISMIGDNDCKMEGFIIRYTKWYQSGNISTYKLKYLPEKIGENKCDLFI